MSTIVIGPKRSGKTVNGGGNPESQVICDAEKYDTILCTTEDYYRRAKRKYPNKTVRMLARKNLMDT